MSSTSERPLMAPRKMSLLQKFNKTHDTFVTHMRLKKDERPVGQHYEQHEPSQAPSSSQSEASTASSPTWNTKFDRDHSTNGSEHELNDAKYPEPEDFDASLDRPRSPSLVRSDGEFGTSFQYAVAHNYQEGSHDFMRVMQNFKLRKRATTTTAVPSRAFHNSPPQSPQSWRSMYSSRGPPSEMSDEQIDDWLDRPEDAEVHRYRKLSAASAISRAKLLEKKELEAKLDLVRKQQQHIEYKSIQAIEYTSDFHPTEEPAALKRQTENDSLPTDDTLPKEDYLQGMAPMRLSLPNELLQEIAFHLNTKTLQPFRLSGMRLNDFIPMALVT